MQRTNVNTSVAVIAALGIFLAGCGGRGGGDDESERTDAAYETTVNNAESGLFDEQASGDDAIRIEAESSNSANDEDERFAEATAEESAAATEPTSEAASATAEAASDAASDRSRRGADSEGGLFGAESSPDVTPPPDESLLEDNTFRDYGYRDFVEASDDPLSTFALDVDTGSYTIARKWVDEGQLPPRESVRPEEFINAFEYDYDAPRNGLELTVDGGPSPFDHDNFLVRVGVQGEIVADSDRGPANLTFVIDTSGSMDRQDRLGLVKDSLRILVDQLNDDDTVAIVTYSDGSGIRLYPTPISERKTILDAIDSLEPGGSTNMESGLREGYALASQAFQHNGINRVVLLSDGVANAGITDVDALAAMIREPADRGIDLVTVGFGMGNFNDVTMEQLADQGDGFYAYVDTEDEAERLFEDELTSTLLTIAKNAKIQVEFDADVVESYRLIGFENRGVADSEFRNDNVDAGELGAGHQVTAIYEVELQRGVTLDDRGDIGEVFLRWEDPDDGEVIEIDDDIDLRDIAPIWTDAADDFQLATVVATFAELLRDNPYAGDVDLDSLSHEADRLADSLNDRTVDDLADLIDRVNQIR
jgi:Ca-activated chloride channel homolog